MTAPSPLTELQRLGQEFDARSVSAWDMAPCNLFLAQEQEKLANEIGCKACGKMLHACPCPELIAAGVVPGEGC